MFFFPLLYSYFSAKTISKIIKEGETASDAYLSDHSVLLSFQLRNVLNKCKACEQRLPGLFQRTSSELWRETLQDLQIFSIIPLWFQAFSVSQ